MADGGGGNGDASVVTPRCTVPARPDASAPRVSLGCDAVLAAQEIAAGGVVRFDCATSIPVGAPIVVNTDTVIDGNGVVFDGQDATQMFRVTNSARLTLLDVTIQRGFHTDNGAGVRVETGTLVAYDSTFRDNHGPASGANFFGGAIAALPPSALVEIYGGRFENNTSANSGAIHSFAGLTVMNAVFTNNAATGTGGNGGMGGAGGAVFVVGPGNTTLCGTSFMSNTAGDIGGAIGIISTNSASIVQLTDVVMSSNEGTGGGGAYIQGAAMLTMRRLSVTENVATAGGAGLWLQGGVFDGENMSIVANRNDGGTGAAMFVSQATGRLAFSTIADNVGTCAGCAAAGIASSSAIDLHGTIIVDNTSPTVPAVCTTTGTNSGATWQWPNDLPACVAGATVTDPLLQPRTLVSGPVGTLLVRRPSPQSPTSGAVMTNCPAEDVLGDPRPTPCAAGAVEPL